MTPAATTPVRRVDAPSSLLRRDAGTTMVATVPPPRPAITLATPVTRNSRSQSSSWLAASSMPATFMTTQMKAIRISVSMCGICAARSAHATRARSAGPSTGHSPPCAVLVSSKPAARASSPLTPVAASTRW